jgi:hypothetical protein
MSKAALAAVRRVDSRILYLRDQKIILDSDLAELYGVEVRHLNQQVKRNSKRFPGEFLFQLSSKDVKSLRSQFVISNNGRGGRRYMPYAFTEYGAIMAATILNSERAIAMSIFVVRAFVRTRQALITNQRIVGKLNEIEYRLENHDADIQKLVDAIRELMTPLPANRRRLGFEIPQGKSKTNSGRSITLIRSSARKPGGVAGQV